MNWAIREGDVLDVLKTLPDDSFDAAMFDPPYGLEFLGESWDAPWRETDGDADGFRRSKNEKDAGRDSVFGRMSRRGPEYKAGEGYQRWCEAWSREMLRVLKPGAPVLACGGTRTVHRLTCGVEDGGFEIRDQLEWIYGQGMPHPASTSDVFIDDHLKVDRDVIGERTLSGNAALSTKEIGGTYSVASGLGAGRTKTVPITIATSPVAKRWAGHGHALRPSHEPIVVARKPLAGGIATNILLWDVCGLNIDACRIDRDGDEPSAGMNLHPLGGWPANIVVDDFMAAQLDAANPDIAGGVSRYFYCAKVSSAEREFGCEDLPLRSPGECTAREDGTAGIGPAAGAGRSGGARNSHPTLKPVKLTTWMARMLLPPPRTDKPRRILVPFAGSGSEMIGAMRAGWDEIVGIERDVRYLPILRARLDRWSQVPAHLEPEDVSQIARATKPVDERQASLFGTVDTADRKTGTR